MSVSVIDDSVCPEEVHVVRELHRTRQGTGRPRKCLKAGQQCDISVECYLEEESRPYATDVLTFTQRIQVGEQSG